VETDGIEDEKAWHSLCINNVNDSQQHGGSHEQRSIFICVFEFCGNRDRGVPLGGWLYG